MQIENKIAEEAQVEVKETPEVKLSAIDMLVQNFPNGPTKPRLEAWKREHGTIEAYVPDDNTLFILRPLKRIEYSKIRADLARVEDPNVVDAQLNERVVSACTLYPPLGPEFFSMSPAGLVPTLFGMVMEASSFVSPEKALSNLYRL